MPDLDEDILIRPLSEVDIGDIVEIDEKQGGIYRPEVWEQRVGYYLRRDPEISVVASLEDRVIGFMLGEVRSGEFGLEESTGWIEVLGVDPEFRGQSIGRRLGEQILERIKNRGATTVRTLVDAGQEDLSGFFLALGFEPAPLKPYVRTL
ncbi:MAG: GNAT family N-acetyltransferase [Deltaproteobacteria bacterium]|nr:GNAT family N-acetyltransferase [Deltaproteobacteria bacterium]